MSYLSFDGNSNDIAERKSYGDMNSSEDFVEDFLAELEEKRLPLIGSNVSVYV